MRLFSKPFPLATGCFGNRLAAWGVQVGICIAALGALGRLTFGLAFALRLSVRRDMRLFSASATGCLRFGWHCGLGHCGLGGIAALRLSVRRVGGPSGLLFGGSAIDWVRPWHPNPWASRATQDSWQLGHS
jgi:hypothetical protein